MSSYIPPQHGAWAFLALPLALGATQAPWSPLLIVLGIAWVAAYPLSYAALGLIRAKRNQRFRRPLLLWLLIFVPASAALVVWRPWLVWVGLLYVALFLVNVVYARRHDERALTNDAVFVVECSLMVAVTWTVAAGGEGALPGVQIPGQVWGLVMVCALVLFGSTLHVKALIRERRNPAYRRASQTFALASLALSVGLGAAWGWPAGLWLIVAFAVLAVRAFAVGRQPLRAGMIGAIELACFVVVVLCAVAANP